MPTEIKRAETWIELTSSIWIIYIYIFARAPATNNNNNNNDCNRKICVVKHMQCVCKTPFTICTTTVQINRNLWHEVTATCSLFSHSFALCANFMIHLLYILPVQPPSTNHFSIRKPFVCFMTLPSLSSSSSSSCYCCCCPLLLKSRQWKTTISHSLR